jgi:hypothetical protein
LPVVLCERKNLSAAVFCLFIGFEFNWYVCINNQGECSDGKNVSETSGKLSAHATNKIGGVTV